MRRHVLAVVMSSVFAVTVSAASGPAAAGIPAPPPVSPPAAGSAASAVAAARQTAGQPAPSPADLASENLFWQSIVNSTNPADFEAYLEAFPDGLFRRLAQNRLDTLSATVALDALAGTGSASTRDSSTLIALQSPFYALMNRYTEAMDRRAPNEVLATIHSNSPLFTMTVQQIEQVFPFYDIQVVHDDFRDLGSDGLDHIATVTIYYTRRSGPVFQNNATKAAVVFRREDGAWRIWAILAIEVTALP